MPLFNNCYRISSSRLPGWDYTTGWYFVTMCTRQRRCWLSQVIDSTVQLSPIGTIVAEEWQRISVIRPAATLDAWVVMPNHVHAILGIGNDGSETATGGAVSTQQSPPLPPSTLRAGSLGAIIGQFKSLATKRIWAAGFRDFGWQARFHDTIIRNQRMLSNIQTYIMDNPARWVGDREREQPVIWQLMQCVVWQRRGHRQPARSATETRSGPS